MSKKVITAKYGIEMKAPRRIPPWLKMLVVIVLIVGGIYSFYRFVVWILAPTEEDIMLLEATPSPTATLTPEPTASPTPTPRPSPTKNPDISYYLMSAQENGDHIKGWINIPGLGVDNVIAQWGDNEYFLDHDINLNSSPYGAVFFDYRSDLSYIMDAGHIVIYGFNNLGGRQLKSVAKYASKEYFGYNTLIILETDYGQYHFRLFSVHIEEEDGEYVMPVAAKEKEDFINLLLEKSMFVPENFPEEGSVILTISIDVESERGNRLLAHAYLEGY